MRKISKKRTERPASSASSSSDDKSETSETKVSNGAGKKDGANNLEDEKNQQKNGDEDKKSNSSKKKSSRERGDGKNNRKRASKDESDESNDSSDDEALSKIAKHSKKSDTSSKGKGSKKGKEKLPEQSIEDDGDALEKEDDVEYEVEEIVSHKKSHGKMLYLIRWKGWGPDDDTWENATTLDNCPDILKKYADANPDSTLPPSKNKTAAVKINKKEKRDKKIQKLKEIVAEKFDENADYEVEKIIDVFFKKDKSREFLVRWKGYRSEYDTWEPEENLNCPDLIEKFMAKVEYAKNLSEKELRPIRKHTERFTLRTQSAVRRLSKRHDGKQRAVYYDAEE